jgi:Tfp pilus assembly protein PilF
MVRNLLTALAACVLLVGLAACQPQPTVVVATPMASAQDYYDAGIRAFGMGDYNNAAAQFDAAIRMAPGLADAYWYLGQCYSRMGMTRRAEDTYRAGLSVAPGHARLHEGLGILSYDTGNHPVARHELAQAAALGSTNPQVFLYLGNLALLDGDCQTAKAHFQRALALDPGYVLARQALADAQGRCRPKAAPRQPTPKVEKSFTGGGRAIDPSDF